MKQNEPVKTVAEIEAEIAEHQIELDIMSDEGLFTPHEIEAYYAKKQHIDSLKWEIKGREALEVLKKQPGIGFVRRVDFDGMSDD